jgi:hypothetical protein
MVRCARPAPARPTPTGVTRPVAGVLARISLADLMRRTFGIDVLECPRCGGRLRLMALIEQAHTMERILRLLGLLTDRPEPRSARAPPRSVDDPADASGVTADDTY